MIPAPKPKNEAKRLACLEEYSVLDTKEEIEFDNLTKLASYICQTPIAIVSLVDKDRQWFKAKVGLDASETPRDLAFCAHAILDCEIMEIPDSYKDARFSDNPLVRNPPNVRFYAGAPLSTPNGQNIGTLCVIDNIPRKLSDEQKAALKALASQVVTQLELRKRLHSEKKNSKELSLENTKIQHNYDQVIIKEKEAKSALDKLKMVFDNVPTGIVQLDENLGFLDANPAFLNWLGYSLEEIRKKTVFDITHADDIAGAKASQESLSRGTPIRRFEKRYIDKKGAIVWGAVNSRRYYDESKKAFTYFSVVEDITEEKFFETQKEEVAHELQRAKEAAEKAAQTKANFLANMSHEIRTPLNGVVGNTSLLLETDLNNEQREMLETVRSCSDSLLALIDDILDFSKIEAGKLQLEATPFDIRRAIDEAIKIITPRAEEKAIKIRAHVKDNVPTVLVCDYTRYRQILLNLLSNAVKFTDKGEVSILIRVFDVAGTTTFIETSVQDNGIGMTSEQQKNLFQDFSQVDASTTRKYGGTGLGLAICRHLTDLLGGKIWCESTPTEGSKFTFTVSTESGIGMLPVNVSKANLHEGIHPFGKDHPLNILVAEDSRTNQILISKFLKKLGYDADIVDNGDLAVKAVLEKNYDIVIMDLHMPILDGFGATRAIRANSKDIDRPYIVALTASVMQSDRKLCYNAGMNEFLKKPLDMVELMGCLRKFIEKQQKKQPDTK